MWMKGTAIPPPELIDVLYCLVLDASVLDFACFEDWADEYGYDTDSRKAERIYKDCLETGLKLRQILGPGGLSELQHEYEGY